MELHNTLLLPTDDLLAVKREFINPAISRAGLGHCLCRHGVADLRSPVERESATSVTNRVFKDYEPGFVHIDIKYLPQLPDERPRPYLFGPIDRATRWGYVDLHADHTDSSSVDFLSKVQRTCPSRS